TSNLTPVVSAYFERHGIGGVREVVGSDKEASKQIKIRQAAARWPDRQPVYVGDTLGDMREAREAGALPVGVAWGWHDQPRLRLGNPSRIVQTPAELAELIG
ncbi:MAG: HAD family hydrolase, partial [Lentisphaeria bacterium]|nr:HAD family hydrolase [Lentisphaeria bacterium]